MDPKAILKTLKDRIQSGDAATRLAICHHCDQYTRTRQCQLCNCFMPAKARLPSSRCPKGLW